MTNEQRVALEHPCYLAGETMHPRFDPQYAGRSNISVKVTVNAADGQGDEVLRCLTPNEVRAP